MQPRQQLQSASSQRGAEDGLAACKLLFSASPNWAKKLDASTNLTDGCSHGHRKRLWREGEGDQREDKLDLEMDLKQKFWVLREIVPARGVPPGWSQPCGG